MLTWLAIRTWTTAAWSSFASWCKERWELLVGILVGVLGVFAFTKGSRDAAKVLEEKNKLIDSLLDAESNASEQEREALKKNLKVFLEANKEADEKFQEKLQQLDKEKRKRVKEILSSDSPEEDIALKLREYLS